MNAIGVAIVAAPGVVSYIVAAALGGSFLPKGGTRSDTR